MISRGWHATVGFELMLAARPSKEYSPGDQMLRGSGNGTAALVRSSLEVLLGLAFVVSISAAVGTKRDQVHYRAKCQA